MTKPYLQVKKTIPFLFTFSNASFGFLSIVKTIEGDFVVAAICIMLAAFMDGIDGTLARYLGTAGPLGFELDSLCDAVSFCLAPSVLLYSWYLHGLGHQGFFVSVFVFYLCAGLFRLAKYNLTAEEQRSSFLGLPSTIAALFAAQLVFYEQLLTEGKFHYLMSEKVVVGLIASIALLMISSIRFPNKANLSFRRSATYFKILLIFFLAVWCKFYNYPFLLLLVTAYILGSLLLSGLFGAKKVIEKQRLKFLK